MSASLIASISRLFGQQERSDCMLVFYCKVVTADNVLQEASLREEQQERAAEVVPNVAEEPAPGPGCKQAAEQELKDTIARTTSDPPEVPGGEHPAAADEGTSDIGGATATQSENRGGSETAEPSAKRRKTVQTQTGSQPELLLADSTAVGDPLPAHSFALSGGSERFRAQLDRWVEEPGCGAKPVLRVPLDSPDDLPHALSAVKFMYTGKLDLADAASLLRVRIQAAYLQVEGCPEACDAALLALVTAPQPSQQQQAAGALAGVAQLYSCRDLISRAEVAPATVLKLLHACQQQLVKQAGSAGSGQQQQQQQQGGAGATEAAALPTGSPGLGELLAWAFGDAPSLMNDPEARKQMEALPAAALEALLGCDSFATDSESTVLLVLLTWLEVNPSCTAESRQRLLKLIRLTQLSDTYLFRLLPLLTCFSISAQELRFLQEYAFATDGKRARMKQEAGPGYDIASGWYRTVPRPAPTAGKGDGGAGRAYEWIVQAAELKAALGPLESPESQTKDAHLFGAFAGGLTRVVANGLEWYPRVSFTKDKDAAGIYLFCALPSSLGLNLAPEAPVLANPGACRLVVYKWDGGGSGGCQRQEAWSRGYTTDFCRLGCGWGEPGALPLSAVPSDAAGTVRAGDAQPQQLLARLAPYLKDGNLQGCLSFGRSQQ